jgi:predicted dehydrogenase
MKRRDFLKTGFSAASLAVLNSRAFAAANEKPIRVELIGSGWYGKTDLLHLNQVAPIDVVGLCDVDAKMLSAAADLVATRQPSRKRPKTFGDYRKLLTGEKPEVVLIATPDHWHCLPCVAACKAGADVYVQKPISHDVTEGQAMVAAARKYNRTVQVGLQRRSTPHLLEARDKIIREGKLGKIAQIEIHAYGGPRGDFPPPTSPPANMDWEMYVGPAAWRDYRPNIHPRSWRDCREFSNGQTGDLCVHFFDAVRYFLDLGWPRKISASGGTLVRDNKLSVNVHDTQVATFDYGDLQIVWNQRNWGPMPDGQTWWGATLYGDKGQLKITIQSYDFIPHRGGSPIHVDFLDEREKYPEDAQTPDLEFFAAPATRRQLQNFLAARQEKKKPVADIEQGHISSACCILANLSMDLGRSLQLDPETGQLKDDDEANKKLAKQYRGDWVHPTPENV